MKVYKLLAPISLAALLIASATLFNSCTETENVFNINAAGLKGQYHTTESVQLSVENPENKAIESVDYYLNDKKVGESKANAAFNVPLAGVKLGYQNIKAVVHSGGATAEATTRVEVVSSIEPKLISDYEIVNTYPHDMTSYTQGLEFYRDTLIEGTGQYGESKLRKVDYKTGKPYKEVGLDAKYFGEGITVFNDKIYQLTWKENTGFIYNAGSLKKEKDFTYFEGIQGWGLTHDDKNLYQSDGSEKIYKLDPATLKEADYINVYTANNKVKAINELEWIDGRLFGNIYQTDAVAIIDPATGAVEAVIDFSALKKKVTQHPELDVLNGIAYNPKTKTIFVTGKNWDKMFEIRLK